MKLNRVEVWLLVLAVCILALWFPFVVLPLAKPLPKAANKFLFAAFASVPPLYGGAILGYTGTVLFKRAQKPIRWTTAILNFALCLLGAACIAYGIFLIMAIAFAY